jgi:hypothetical protein
MDGAPVGLRFVEEEQERGNEGRLAVAVFDVGDFAVAHVEDAIGDLGGLGVVGDHEDGLVELAAGLAEHLENGVGIFGVEVAGGLVGEDDGGAGDEGAGDSDTLLLAAGELVGAVVETALDAEHLGEVGEKGLVEIFLYGRAELGDVVGDFNVAHRGERWQEVEALEDEADFGATHFGALGVGESGEVHAVDQDGAGGGAGEAAKDVEKGGLAGAGGADDGDELTGRDGEANFVEGGDFEFAGAVGFPEVLGENDGRHYGRTLRGLLLRRGSLHCGGALFGVLLKRGCRRWHVFFQVYVNEVG